MRKEKIAKVYKITFAKWENEEDVVDYEMLTLLDFSVEDVIRQAKERVKDKKLYVQSVECVNYLD